MMFYYVEPEVAGGLGDGAVMDTAVNPPLVSELEYEFSGWLGDELLESFPCFVVTKNLAAALMRYQFTGFVLDAVVVTKTEEFNIIHPSTILPGFHWLKVHGVAGVSDFGIAQDCRLVVSEVALGVIRGCRFDHADVEVYSKA
ncbi:hypothetical protein DVB73_04030 [Pseudomonas plecoglossicida]|uniref:Uncharacterized protein n=2 Tax=Pseudomonas plecoglossicida TaxID=70775 RepID=A0AAD0R236_PSEDL|nr:hypothetical protein DVB73_04030 [Pseudomonas plecoglossicida]QLB57999.1 hypothetical protein HAV28_13575 [Pseudomonas plecoglossicida]